MRSIAEEEMVVVNCTGHTFPVEKHVLGDQWAVDVHLSEGQSPAPREGLQAALENLDEKTTTVLLIDDNADDALLIRRLLEGTKHIVCSMPRMAGKAFLRPDKNCPI